VWILYAATLFVEYATCKSEIKSMEGLGFIMKSNFCKERRGLLKSTCTLVGATALVSVGGSLNAFAAGGAMPVPQASGVPKLGDTFVFSDGQRKGEVVSLADVVVDAAPITVQAKDTAAGTVRDGDHSTVLLWRSAPGNIPADMKDAAAEGVMAFSGVCTHLGCMLCDWLPATHEMRCPCHEATFDLLQVGKNTGGAVARPLPFLPLKVVDGKLVVADKFVGYVGPKRG
jgi:rieske iron-sulfur protein